MSRLRRLRPTDWGVVSLRNRSGHNLIPDCETVIQVRQKGKGRRMRLPLIPPTDLAAEQRQLYDDMRKGIEANFKGFTAIDDGGRLIGPWNPWLHFPKFGGPVWELVKALSTAPKLPRPVREIAILVTGAHFHSAYEIYAHVLVAELRGIDDDKIATIIAGQRPGNLTREEAVAYDLASALVSGGVLPELTYRQAVDLFGEEATAEFIYLVGLYCMVSVTLNGFDVPIPAPTK
jgi:4-carboxymuconolactone decarboxylase